MEGGTEMNRVSCSLQYLHRSETESRNAKHNDENKVAGSLRAPKVHVNPNFKNGKSLVIHVNPRMHQNRKIHVNPKIMKDIVPTSEEPKMSEVSPNVDEIAFNDRLISADKQIKKSIYVNPKLMEKLTSSARDGIEAETTSLTPVLAISNKGNSLVTSRTNEIPIDANQISNKSATNRLLTLSRRKLVRVGSTTRKLTTTQSTTTLKRLNSKSFSIAQDITKKSPSQFNLRKFSSIKNKHKIGAYKIDRTAVERRKRKKISIPGVSNGYVNKGLVAIGGVMYQSSRTQLVRSAPISSIHRKKLYASNTKGDTFVMAKNGKKLHRLNTEKEGTTGTICMITRNSISRRTIVKKVPNSVAQTSHKNVISYKAKQRSLQILRDKLRKNYIPCLLYRRFGYCEKFVKGTCPKLHDKKQVALCKNFLQGKCLLDNCPLSHDIGPEKMPTCKYFLEGCCIRDGCPYLHVKVSPNTPICAQFLRGYCADGNKCKQRHTYICPEYEKSGNCAKGKYCPFPHKVKSSSTSVAKTKTAKNNRRTSSKENTRNLSPKVIQTEEDNRKRYYDKASPTDAQLAEMRENILKKMKCMKASLGVTDSSDKSIEAPNNTIIDDNSEEIAHSYNERPKRLPIGPLPAYIPIN